MRVTCRITLVAALCAWLAGVSVASADQRIIVRTKKPYEPVKHRIEQLGGIVTHEFKHADGLVVLMPDGQLDALEKTIGVDYVARDEVVPNPHPREVVGLDEGSALELPADAAPQNYYSYNAELTGAIALHAAGGLGQNVIVGIIDSGVSRTAAALCNGPCATGTRVIGGENFVPGAFEPGANASTNNPHGTWVASMVGANIGFLFSKTTAFAQAVRRYCNPVAACSTPFSPTLDLIPMVGQAPAVQFFAFKVFPAIGSGAPVSRILAAMDRAIELKNTTLPNMRVVNMSLGGATLHAGRDIEDELASSMAASGISLVTSAGNAGPSGTTIGSPGTARNILTVGAASSAVHERILRDLEFGPGVGALYRPDDSHQIADFSSRGPNADGRIDPEVVANGVGSYAQNANGLISWVDGSSFAAPTVTGIVAALYSLRPDATPSQIRSAIIRSARRDVVPTARAVDQGAGYVDAAGALALLDTGVRRVSDTAPGRKTVAQNLEKGADIETIDRSPYSGRLRRLRPSERREFYYEVKPHTASVKVTLSNITPELPPSEQNAFFGDDIQLAVHSAKTSAIGEGDYLARAFVNADRTFVFEKPETGLMRITVLGDWTNAGRISTDVRIESVYERLPRRDFRGELSEGDVRTHAVDIPVGTASVTFRLSWENDWGSYPTNDLDLVLQPPGGPGIFTGTTFNSPETVTIKNPTPGTWTLFVDGFTVAGRREKYELRIDYD